MPPPRRLPLARQSDRRQRRRKRRRPSPGPASPGGSSPRCPVRVPSLVGIGVAQTLEVLLGDGSASNSTMGTGDVVGVGTPARSRTPSSVRLPARRGRLDCCEELPRGSRSMTVRDPEKRLTITFCVETRSFTTEARRGQIVHEAFHAALPHDLTVGHRLTFRTPNGVEVFADNFLGDVLDHFGTTTLVTSATPIAGERGPWRNIGFDQLAITVA